MAMPPPPPLPPAGLPRFPRKRKSKLHPQAVVSRFWTKYHCKTPGKVTSIFPRKLYKGLAPSSETSSGDVHNAGHSYAAARAECEAMVRKIVTRCEQTNSRFTDFDFDIETDHWLGERNCLYGLGRPQEDDSDSDDDDLDPRRMNKSWKTVMKSGILMPTTQVNLHQLQRYLGTSSSDSELPSRRRSTMTPMSVHRVDWIFENPQFTIDGYSSSDIKQGACGNCWWLAAVSNIAHRRDLMDKICVARDEECGVYGFVFHRDGEWIPTVVDDNLYLTQLDFGFDNEVYDSRGKKARLWKKQYQTGSEALYFSKCEEENETWLPLMEKAYAKVHGDYDAIHGGWAGSGVEDLTGGVNNMILANRVLRKERLWREMLTIDQEKGEFVFGLSASTDFRDLAGRKNGIVQSHAYSVLRATEVEDEQGKKHKLIKMRNPWGQRAENGVGEWHGPWSDGSKEWTPHMIRRLNHEPADDGVFWMSFEDVLSNFKWIHRTRLFDEKWTIAQQWTSENVSWMPGYMKTKFVVEVKQAGLTVIVLSKLDNRYFKGLEGRYWHYLEFIVRKPGSTEIIAEARGFPHSDRRSVNCEIYLEPGSYEVYPKVTSEFMGFLDSVERVVQKEATRNPKKLRQVGTQYDVAHAKAGVLDEDAEQERKKNKLKRKDKQQRRKQDKMHEMRTAMTQMQIALSDMTKQLEQKDQKKDKEKIKDKDKEKDRDEMETDQDRSEEIPQGKEERKDEYIPEVAKLIPGFWPGDSFKSNQPSGEGEAPVKGDNKPDDRTQSRSTQTRDAPQQPEPEPQPVNPQPEPSTPSLDPVFTPPTQPSNDGYISSSSSGSSGSNSDSDSGASSDTGSVLSVPPPHERNPSWNPVCVMCLRVYAQDKDVSVKLAIKPPTGWIDAEMTATKEKEKMELEAKDDDPKEDDKNEEDKGDEKERVDKNEIIEEIKEAQEKWLKLLLASGERKSQSEPGSLQ